MPPVTPLPRGSETELVRIFDSRSGISTSHHQGTRRTRPGTRRPPNSKSRIHHSARTQTPIPSMLISRAISSRRPGNPCWTLATRAVHNTGQLTYETLCCTGCEIIPRLDLRMRR
jgi:hypothetical protein